MLGIQIDRLGRNTGRGGSVRSLAGVGIPVQWLLKPILLPISNVSDRRPRLRDVPLFQSL
jgi:hypothetical protein